ncbi:hypothetical protein ACIGDI_39455 [Streptomyces sp. NPDC085900]
MSSTIVGGTIPPSGRQRHSAPFMAHRHPGGFQGVYAGARAALLVRAGV